MKCILFFILFISFQQSVNAQLITRTFEEVENLHVKKPIIVFLHAKWCKYCDVMENTTFKNEEVIKKLNNHYYFISFDVESKESIKFHDRIFNYKPSGYKTGIHELAEALGNTKNKLSYPTTVILNTKHEIIFQYPSLLRPKGFLKLLNVLKENETL